MLCRCSPIELSSPFLLDDRSPDGFMSGSDPFPITPDGGTAFVSPRNGIRKSASANYKSASPISEGLSNGITKFCRRASAVSAALTRSKEIDSFKSDLTKNKQSIFRYPIRAAFAKPRLNQTKIQQTQIKPKRTYTAFAGLLLQVRRGPDVERYDWIAEHAAAAVCG